MSGVHWTQAVAWAVITLSVLLAAVYAGMEATRIGKDDEFNVGRVGILPRVIGLTILSILLFAAFGGFAP